MDNQEAEMRVDGTLASPGGHVEDGETSAQAAIRETREEFGITPTAMKYLGRLENLPEEEGGFLAGLQPPKNTEQYGKPHIYLCTAYKGYPKCDSGEVLAHRWIAPDTNPD
jgi:8-oxo-dGTP pyrophosphatase MutT (NUDIX family)